MRFNFLVASKEKERGFQEISLGGGVYYCEAGRAFFYIIFGNFRERLGGDGSRWILEMILHFSIKKHNKHNNKMKDNKTKTIRNNKTKQQQKNIKQKHKNKQN